MADERFEVPLFPLNVVLFPGMALPLHVFEPRYRHMIADCLADRAPFGVVLAESEDRGESEDRDADADAGSSDGESGPVISARVGTLARIADYEKLPDGRYNLLAKGTRRFEVLHLHAGKPYLTATVRPVQDDDEGVPEGMIAAARTALEAYLHAVMALVGSADQPIAIPDDPLDLSYLVGTCLTCEDCEKQVLLEMRSLARRLREGARMLRKETALLTQQGGEIATPDRSMLN